MLQYVTFLQLKEKWDHMGQYTKKRPLNGSYQNWLQWSYQPWRWGLDEEMPEEVTVSNYDKDSTYALKYGKIYRATDFVKDYESYQAAKKQQMVFEGNIVC